MKRTFLTLALALTLGQAHRLIAVDFDNDKIDDGTEQQLLEIWAPVWRPEDGDDTLPPLPIRWYVEHCRMNEYFHPNRQRPDGNHSPGDYNGDSNKGTLVHSTEDLTLESATILARTRLLPNHFLRLEFKQGRFHDGNDPNSPRKWSTANTKEDCIYGRCCHLEGMPHNYYLLQYFLFFGWNDVDADRNTLGCPIGNHEGDIICVEFEVSTDLVGNQKKTFLHRAVFHNHGRQIFIDNVNSLTFVGNRPVVYLEAGTHEALPWSGGCGFKEGTVPLCIGTNDYFDSKDVSIFNVPVGGECDDVPAVRVHLGRGTEISAKRVVNLGERGNPGPSAEAHFVSAFSGLYGSNATDCCDDHIPFNDPSCNPTDSPPGPQSQGAMWDRAWVGKTPGVNGGPVSNRNYRDPRWPGCIQSNFDTPVGPSFAPFPAEVWVNFNYQGFENGNESTPFNTLAEAVEVVIPGDAILIKSGQSPETITLTKPTTLKSSGGAVTIGR